MPVELTVQAAAWHGRITDLQVLWPGAKPWREPESFVAPWKVIARDVTAELVTGLAYLFAAFMAARNLRAGRGDRRGAWRLALAIFILEAAIWVCSTHWMADAAMIGIITDNAAQWLMSAVLIWMLYIGLEPAVRARWPHAMLTWSRVLAGRWQDAQVAAHVLYGGLVGFVIAGFFLVYQAIDTWRNNVVAAAAGADAGLGTRNFIAEILGKARGAAEFGLLVIFAIFCLRVVFKKDWIAAIAAALIFTGLENGAWQGSIVNFLFFFAIFALLVFVLMRLGLAATMAALFFCNTLLRTPGAQSLTKPYESAVVIYPALLLAIVVWAFWRTSGQQLMTIAAEEK